MVKDTLGAGLGGTAFFFFIIFQLLSIFNTAFSLPTLIYIVKWLALLTGVLFVLNYASKNPKKGMVIVIIVAIVMVFGLPALVRDTSDFVSNSF